MRNFYADTGYPEGFSQQSDSDLNLAQLVERLIGRTVAEVTFDDGNFVLRFDDGTSVLARGNSAEDQTMTLHIEARD